jgi:hypothetical protein
MEADRLNRIIAALAVLYVIYIAVALSWSRLHEAIRSRRRREISLVGFNFPRERPRWERRGPQR